MRYVRLALIALVAAAVPLATATPAAATTQLASCGGTAPLQTTCSTTGTFPSSGGSFVVGCSGVLVGTVHVVLTTTTGSVSMDCIPVDDVNFIGSNHVSTGTFSADQSFTLTGEATGAGLWNAAVWLV